MSRLGFRDGERVTLVGVNSATGRYHYAGCRYYASTDTTMSRAAAMAAGYVCGSCCVKEEE